MQDKEPKRRREIVYHDNGKVRAEVTYVGDHIHGTTRHWHENGVLAEEVPMANSRVNGVVRRWNPMGQLLGECQFVDGTGVSKTWYEDGTLAGEVHKKNGIPHGPLRAWDEGGEFLVEQYFIDGRRLSRKQYEQLRKEEPSLSPPQRISGNIEKLPERTPPRVKPDDYDDAIDALIWLKESSRAAVRTLGELEPKESLELVNEILSVGAKRVVTAGIFKEDDGSQNSGLLIVEIPDNIADRNAVFEYCNEQNVAMGFDPVKDDGRSFLLVALD